MKRVLQFKGIPISMAIKELSKVKGMTIVEFEKWQIEKRDAIFEHHKLNNNFYKQFIAEIQISCWEDIPILKKQDYQVNSLKKLLSDDIDMGNVFVNHTSGSSGVPFYFAKDKYSHAMTWAIIYDRYNWHDIDIDKDLQARFYTYPSSTISKYKEIIKDLLIKRRRFNIIESTDKAHENIINKLRCNKYKYINGYSSSLGVFARYLLKNNILLKSICPTLKIAIVTAAILKNEDRENISKAFGIPIVNEYGASELGIIAFEDKDGNWLMNDDEFFFEVIKDSSLEDENIGKLVVTSLFNKAMPFIRYEVGDLVEINNFKIGKYSKLNRLVGRLNDYILLESGEKISVAVLDYAIKHLVKENYFLKEFVIKQYDYNRFILEYVSDVIFTEEQRLFAEKQLIKYLKNENAKFDFVNKDRIERNSWKLKYFERLF